MAQIIHDTTPHFQNIPSPSRSVRRESTLTFMMRETENQSRPQHNCQKAEEKGSAEGNFSHLGGETIG